MIYIYLSIICSIFFFQGCKESSTANNNLEQNTQNAIETENETEINEKNSTEMYTELAYNIEAISALLPNIPQERKEQLDKIAQYIETQKQANDNANLTFICTHNSRRSHLCQIWAATAAAYYGLDKVNTYSGGTEATAFNPRAVAALERAGFIIDNPGGENPQYQVSFAENGPKMVCFSKRFDDTSNAQENFVAIMTCSDADQACPYVPGASLRVAIPYIDPKIADDTELEESTYDERSKQIASEMFYIMSRVKA